MAAEAVKVIVRCRPMNKRENDLGCEIAVAMSQGVTCTIINPSEKDPTPKTFTFDGAYYLDSTTEQIYNDVAFPLVESVLEGYNGTVFAYGQTGCGKSFTMQGVPDPPTQRGIIPRAFEHIFEVIQTSENMKYLVYASYLEIYNEEIRDLLSNDIKRKLDLKENPDTGVYVQGLTKHSVHSTEECEKLMDQGWSNRTTGATLMNSDSSRSHSIFTIYVEMMETSGDNPIRGGKLNLVDLAGSERQAKTGATGDRLKEATKINLSLSALGNVISALVDGKSKHIPYRDSKLTRLLQDSLGGNTKTLMVACLSPADNNYDESLSTLRYANRAKNIKNKPRINEDPKDAMLREYQEEIRKLKDLLAQQGPTETVVSVAPDEKALEEEREKVRKEYELEMKRMKEAMQTERENNALLQANMDSLKKKYEMQIQKVSKKIEEQKRQKSVNASSVVVQTQAPKMVNGETVVELEETDASPYITPMASIAKDVSNAQMMTSMQEEVLKRLKELETQMVGGEKAQDVELKAKRQSRKKYMEKRMKILSDALKNVDDEDGLMLKMYDDIHEELRARKDMGKKQKQKIKTLQQEIIDLTEEFQEERTDYLETIRRQDQQIKLLNAILDKVQPLIRKDCNYSGYESIKKNALWDEEYQRWKVPEVTTSTTKLPPAASLGVRPKPQASLLPSSNGYPQSYTYGWVDNSTFPRSRGGSQEDLGLLSTPPECFSVDDSPGASREPSPLPPDPFFQKLEKSAEENIAVSYFKPKRANELLLKLNENGYHSKPQQPKKNSNSYLNTTLSNNTLNSYNLSSSFNNSGGLNNSGDGSYNSSWGSNSSSSSNGGGSMAGSNGLGVLSTGWMGTTSPEMSIRRPPARLPTDSLPMLDKNKRKNREVLHTLDLL